MHIPSRGHQIKIPFCFFAVSFARLMYPQEAAIVCAHLDTYVPLTSSSGSGIASRKRKPSVDLNEEPAQWLAGLVGVDVVDECKESRLESLRHRCDALRKASEYLSSHPFHLCFCLKYYTFFLLMFFSCL